VNRFDEANGNNVNCPNSATRLFLDLLHQDKCTWCSHDKQCQCPNVQVIPASGLGFRHDDFTAVLLSVFSDDSLAGCMRVIILFYINCARGMNVLHLCNE